MTKLPPPPKNLTKNQKLESLTEYTRSDFTLRAEKQNRYFEESLEFRLKYLDWKQELWQKKYHERIESLQKTLKRLSINSGKSSQAEPCSRLPSAYPRLLLGGGVSRKLGGQGSKLTTRDIRTPYLTNDSHRQLGWDLRKLRTVEADADLYKDEELFSIDNMNLWRNGRGRLLGRHTKSVHVADYDQRYTENVIRSQKKSKFHANRARYQSSMCSRRFGRPLPSLSVPLPPVPRKDAADAVPAVDDDDDDDTNEKSEDTKENSSVD